MIYHLDIDYAHITKENPEDAELIKFDGWGDVGFRNPRVDEYARGVPPIVEFVGNLASAACFDHLITVPSLYLLVSKKMVQVLQSVRSFSCQLFPTKIYSRKIRHLVMDEYSERTSYEVSDQTLYTDDFVILKVSDVTDCLDRDRTLVEGVPFSQSSKEYLGGFPLDDFHFVFREPVGGFPPVFYVPGVLFYCYSEEAKQACERAGLRGLVFQPLP